MLAELLRDRITVVWTVLIAATATSWLLGVGHELSPTSSGVAILVIAVAKVRFVGRYFMELRNAPLPLLILFECWVLVVGIAMVGLFLFA